MSKTAMINIKVDTEIKKDVENLYSSFGISLSEAVKIFFNQSLIVNGLPFAMRIPKYNSETLAAIEEVVEMKKNPHLYKSFDSVEELFDDLNNDDEI